MKPLPWSHSALGQFKNCPRQYYEVRIAKSVRESRSEAMIWGEEVHKHFENRLKDGVVLPSTLEAHEPFLKYLNDLPGHEIVEDRIALDEQLRPCGFFDKNVWYRGVIDYGKVNGTNARIVDHKTGKVKNNFDQLKLFAIHTFTRFPEVTDIRAEYYWTQNLSTSGETYTRDQVPELWEHFVPDLKQYAQAFQDDVWQPRQSGLCNGWCPVTGCEFWKPKRKR